MLMSTFNTDMNVRPIRRMSCGVMGAMPMTWKLAPEALRALTIQLTPASGRQLPFLAVALAALNLLIYLEFMG
jgi:hypothetical protein